MNYLQRVIYRRIKKQLGSRAKRISEALEERHYLARLFLKPFYHFIVSSRNIDHPIPLLCFTPFTGARNPQTSRYILLETAMFATATYRFLRELCR